jgi:hypothetical protein
MYFSPLYTFSEHEKEIPTEFLCALTHRLLVDPCICGGGKVCEREEIEMYLESNANICPFTGKHFAVEELVPAIETLDLLNEFYMSRCSYEGVN